MQKRLAYAHKNKLILEWKCPGPRRVGYFVEMNKFPTLTQSVLVVMPLKKKSNNSHDS